ncbi:MAG: class I SAM-dependent methyltransferase [Saprospiraceae bacterium]|nr:class I SAM-dependent methyltransferase [Saprospiraceae bacterium]
MKKYPSHNDEWNQFKVDLREDELIIGDWQVMQAWELPLMKALAKEVTWNHGDILEIGFGMGISSGQIMEYGCKSHTIIEAHPVVAQQAREWAKKQKVPVIVLEGFWQNLIPALTDKFDGILFDTYPLKPEERGMNHFSFIPLSVNLLKKGGVLTYYSDEKLPFRHEHLDLIFTSFKEVKLQYVGGLTPPEDCEYWQENYMIIPVCKLDAEGI